MKLKPILDRVVLKEEKKENVHSNLFIPKEEDEGLKQAIVVAVGDGTLAGGNKTTLQVEVGDKVVYSKYGGMQYIVDDEIYYIVRQSDILAIVEEWYGKKHFKWWRSKESTFGWCW